MAQSSQKGMQQNSSQNKIQVADNQQEMPQKKELQEGQLQEQQGQNNNLLRSWFPRSLFRSGASRFPAFWEEFENELAELSQDSNSITIFDDGKNINVEAALPGLQASDINVTLDKGILRIQGERNEENEDKGRKYFRKASNSFSYRLTIPEGIDERTEPKASFKNGLLKLAFSKNKETQGKKIQIKEE